MLACILSLDNKLDNNLHVLTDKHMLAQLPEWSIHHSQEYLAMASFYRAGVVTPLKRRPGFVILKLHGRMHFSSYMISQAKNLLVYLLHTINFIR